METKIINTQYQYNKTLVSNVNFSAKKNKIKNNEENKQETIVDKIEKEKNKFSTKKAIAAGSLVLFIGGLVAVLNPKNSSKILKNIKKWQIKNRIRHKNNKDNFFKTKFGQFLDKTLDKTGRLIQFTGNFNNGKDILYKNLCSNKRTYRSVKNNTLRNTLVKTNNIFTNVMTKINNGITKIFDNISKSTVKNKYKKALESINILENSLNELKIKLPKEEQLLIDNKLKEITILKERFSKTNLQSRLDNQEKIMQDLNLENKVKEKIFKFFKGYKDNKDIKGLMKHTDDSLSLWAEDILKLEKDKIEKEGYSAVSKLFGGEKCKKGLYDEILDITKQYLSPEDQKILYEYRKKSAKKLRNANISECVEYFDKKRDLFLGGAPTDILTAVFGVSLGSTAIITADSKEERKAKLFGDTTFPLIPTILGVFSSIIMTAKLYSGAIGLLVGGAVTMVLSKLGTLFNKYVLDYDEDAIHEAKKLAEKERKELLKAEKLQKRLEKEQKKEIKNV